MSWYGDSADASAHTVSTRTALAYVPSIYTTHTPSMVHSLHSYYTVPTPLTFNYGTSDPPSPSYDSSPGSVTTKGNPKTYNNPPNPVQNAIADPNLNPSLSDYFSLDSSDS